MEKEQSHMTERILDLTLEIIYLLTGENYITFKISDGLVASGKTKTGNPIIEPPSQSLKQSHKKVKDITSDITELLTGENYITFKFSEGLVASNMKRNQSHVTEPPESLRKNERVQEITCEIIELLMGEMGQCLEGDEDLYKEVMMGSEPPLTLPDGLNNRNPPERWPNPLSSKDPKHHRIPQEDKADCRMEAKGEAEESSVMGDDSCKEEEVLPDNSTDLGDTEKDLKAEEEDEIRVVIKEEEIPIEISTDPGDIKAEEEDKNMMIKDECTMEVNTDGKSEANTPSNHHIALEGPTSPTLLLVLPSADLSSDPSTHGDNLLSSSPPIVHHPSARGGETFRCPECGECFSKREILTSHRISHTKPSSESDQDVPRKLYVIEHELIPLKPYSCSECGKCFTQKGHVVLHQRTHTGEKPYSCSECGKGFPAKSALSKHKRMHTGEKPFSCSECGKSFSFNSALTKHKKTHTGEKPYTCSDCGRCFSQRDHLIAHQKTHTGEKPFSCSECGKSFAKKGNLETHQTIHTGDRPYSCSVCGKGFRSKSNLLRHKKVHRGLKPHACPECGKQFKTEFTLSLHLRSHEAMGITIIGCSQ